MSDKLQEPEVGPKVEPEVEPEGPTEHYRFKKKIGKYKV